MQIEDSYREHNREDSFVKELPIFIISTVIRESRSPIPLLAEALELNSDYVL